MPSTGCKLSTIDSRKHQRPMQERRQLGHTRMTHITDGSRVRAWMTFNSDQLRNFSHSPAPWKPRLVFALALSFAMQPTYRSYPSGCGLALPPIGPMKFPRLSPGREFRREMQPAKEKSRNLLRDSESRRGPTLLKDESFFGLFAASRLLASPNRPRLSRFYSFLPPCLFHRATPAFR